METTTVYRVFTISTAAFGGTDRKKDFETFADAIAYARKQGAKVTGFKRIETQDWTNTWRNVADIQQEMDES